MEINRQDSTSIAAYGKRTMVIGQADVPYIDTYQEMWNLLGVALNVLKDVPATDGINTQFMYHLDPNDLIDTSHTSLTTGTAKVGITKISHSLSPGGGAGRKKAFTTSIVGIRDRITGYSPPFTGEDKPETTIAPTVYNLAENTSFFQDADGSYTKSFLRCTRIPDTQAFLYAWRWSIKDSGEWIFATTTEPELALPNLPPNTEITWSARAKLKGGVR